MAYSVAQAAMAIGKSKNTVLRAISSGKIFAVRDKATGAFQIEPSELHRVFAPAATASHGAGHDAPDGAIRAAVLQAQLSEKEVLIAVLERANEDLRRRLDEEAGERRRLTLLLADRRQKSEPVTEQPAATGAPLMVALAEGVGQHVIQGGQHGTSHNPAHRRGAGTQRRRGSAPGLGGAYYAGQVDACRLEWLRLVRDPQRP